MELRETRPGRARSAACRARAWFASGAMLVLFGAATAGGAPPADIPGNAHSLPRAKLPVIAVLPFENLSASPAPLKAIRASFLERLKERGVNLLGEKELASLMARHRVRYVGGVERKVAEAFRTEAEVERVLVTSLALYMEQNPPKLAIMSRLVSTDARSAVTWADSVAMAGDDTPGFLGLGLVGSMQDLIPGGIDRLADSLAFHLLSGGHRTSEVRPRKRYRPQSFFRSPALRKEKRYSIAILPVVNHGARKNAGELLAGVLIEQLVKTGRYEVLEPGMVRDEFLKYRMVTPEGASLDMADILFERLDAELLLTGKVVDYDDGRGGGEAPRVTFSIQGIERKSRGVVWASHSTNRGDEGVFFFGMGMVSTAHELSSRMAAEVLDGLGGGRTSPPKGEP